MKAINLFSLALCALCVVKASKFNATTRILGGGDAKRGQFPYQVSIRYKNNHYCGGSIINNWFILTAAHCTQGDKSYPDNIKVVVGARELKSGGTWLSIEKITNFPNYSPTIFQNDISLLRTAQEIHFTVLIQPIALPTSNLMIDGASVVVSGWGFTKMPDTILDTESKPSNILQFTKLKVLDIYKCIDKFKGKVKVSHICTQSSMNEGVCTGDKGGPLVDVNDPKTLVGIILSSAPCGTKDPEIFTRVYAFIAWIKQEMAEQKPELTTVQPPTEAPTEMPTEKPTEPSTQATTPTPQITTSTPQTTTLTIETTTSTPQTTTPSIQITSPTSQITTPSSPITTPSSQTTTPTPQTTAPPTQTEKPQFKPVIQIGPVYIFIKKLKIHKQKTSSKFLNFLLHLKERRGKSKKLQFGLCLQFIYKMKTINLFILALCAVCVLADIKFPKINPTNRILGGKEAAKYQFPYQASLRKEGKHFCGGSIISSWFIVTAASCTHDSNPNDIEVVVGAVKLYMDGVPFSLEKIINHPEYDKKKIHNDISLLLTAKEISFTSSIQSIALPAVDRVIHERVLVVSGWGTKKPLTESNQLEFAELLQYIDVEVLDLKMCAKNVPSSQLIESNICTSRSVETGVCTGDKGGPLVDENDKNSPNGQSLVGIVSSEISCGTKNPDIFTRVYSFIDWIETQMKIHKPEMSTEKPQTDKPAIHIGPVFVYIENIEIYN
ncbi:uncharacterized protein LOC116343091 [Contarinia nasturtii]|uniref:uncharacterized protein LOC116343091 n=1 Tax=Contarinia nasturtii TaxID=265458 RepID=UPI0012D4C3CF|nr:uncharacterized protein LOC116343091 [Contarinia nasturtii]